ncbi:helix-turn-helix transcriptional regulator [Limimaricola pyoseonensis]|uniref:Transcriptional regulator, AlpA family n=1 Tax=Limimaricola pyoseonensis TaxID=521013 RepID=A0A1G7D7Y1_9RHOB|nr:AlpA family transcriptional regulator [Limimaricola pyoseonensis]SDE47643.1 transcriptional regulator, AlpA family [Limimaricola pyoseonensis]
MSIRHLRRNDVEHLTGLSRSSLYAMMQKGQFPRPVRLGERAVAWPESAVQDWLASRPTAQSDIG